MKTPKTSQDFFSRALALHGCGQRTEAEALYRKAIFRNPKRHDALFALSVLLFETGRFEESRRHLERAVEVRPSEPRYLTNLGEAYLRQGDLERIQTCRKPIRISPSPS